WHLGLEKATAAPLALSSPSVTPFTDPLPFPLPTLRPAANPAYPGADYYEIAMRAGTWKFNTQFQGPATTWGYWGTGASAVKGRDVGIGYLGPTIEARQGRPIVIKYINQLPATNAEFPVAEAIDFTIMHSDLAPGRATPHLHGSLTAPQFDGHPDSWFAPRPGGTGNLQQGTRYGSLAGAAANEAIFWHPNEQPATMLWYHDHAIGITRLNVYVGLAALYFIRDAKDNGKPNNPLGVPGGPFEVPLVIQDKSFRRDGSLFYDTQGVTPTHPIWVPEFFGDTPVINAVAYPFLNVEPRRYRFRMVNGSQARFYNLSLTPTGSSQEVPLWVIGMEQGLLPAPVSLTDLLIAPGERADVIVDFTGLAGQTVTMTNDANAPFPDGDPTAITQLMQFRVAANLSSKDNTADPARGELKLPALSGALIPTISAGTVRRQIAMKERMDEEVGAPIEVKLNERGFHDPVEEKPRVNSTEVWEYINLTEDAHPMHMHLVRFQVVDRQPLNVDLFWADYSAWVGGGRIGAQPNVNAETGGVPKYLNGAVAPPTPQESGWKETAISYPGQVLRVVARFELPKADKVIAGTAVQLPAQYVYHCHILEHEENDMMRPFEVVP
ncbi:MAG TPA: multicopper oxidase, partial [Chloroflexota bacterium]|nr:multicopper oxidase [Chloroflexota bacterium]